MRLIRRPTHGHACDVVLLQCVGVVAVGCVFEARRPWLRISSALHQSFAFDVPIDGTNVLSWARSMSLHTLRASHPMCAAFIESEFLSPSWALSAISCSSVFFSCSFSLSLALSHCLTLCLSLLYTQAHTRTHTHAYTLSHTHEQNT